MKSRTNAVGVAYGKVADKSNRGSGNHDNDCGSLPGIGKTQGRKAMERQARPCPLRFPPPHDIRFKQTFWNEETDRIFTKTLFGWVGINFYSLLEKMRVVGDFYLTEDDFLMPTESLRKILGKPPGDGLRNTTILQMSNTTNNSILNYW